MTDFKRKVSASKIQRQWRLYLTDRADTQSNLEAFEKDYRYRTDKLFDFSQIEMEQINSQDITFRDD